MRGILAAALLIATVGHAQELETPWGDEPVPESPPRRFTLWTTGLVDWLVNFTSAPLGGGLHVSLPVGLNVRRSESMDWVFELRPMLWRDRCPNTLVSYPDRCGTLMALRSSVGLAWTPWRGERGNGFFIQPKVSGMVIHHTTQDSQDVNAERRELGGQVSIGFDLGYRYLSENSRFFLAPVVGIAVGQGWNQTRGPLGFGMLSDYHRAGGWQDRSIVDLNLDILRVGGTF